MITRPKNRHRRAHVGCLRPRLRRVATATGNVLGLTLQQREFVLGCFALVGGGNRRRWRRDRHRLLPAVRRRHPQAACPRAARHAPRGDREDRGAGRETDPQGDSGQGAAHHQSTIGLPFSLNLAFVPSDNISGMNAELLISLHKGHKPTGHYQRLIREKLNAEFPGSLFYFQTADIVSQVLNFGLSAPIDIQIQDSNFPRAYATAQRILTEIQKVPGVVDPPHHPDPGFPAHADRRRPAARRAARRGAARRRQQHADVACRQRAGRPDLFPQSAERRELHRRGADAARQDRTRSPTCSACRPIRRRPTSIPTSGDHADHAPWLRR